MSYTLPELPYAYDALEPHFDTTTMTIHHQRHHQAYVDNLNKAIAGTDAESKELEDIQEQWRRTLQSFFFLENFVSDAKDCSHRETGGRNQYTFWKPRRIESAGQASRFGTVWIWLGLVTGKK